MKLNIGAATDAGRVRDGNEDAFLVDERMGLFAVADGMGGHRAGEVASATALEALRANVASGIPIRDAIENANVAVFERSEADENLRGMGTTITAGTVALGDTLLVGHVGDSRLYLLRDGELRRVTEDHSLVGELVRDGQITPDQAAVHPRRSVITRSVGIDEDVEVDLYPVKLRVGDRLLFCSDGLTDMLRDDDIASVLRREGDPQRVAAQLVADANRVGGEDNITVVVVDAAAGDSLVTDPAPLPDEGQLPEAAVVEDESSGDAVVHDTGPGETEAKPRRGAARTVLRLALWVLPILAVLALAVGTAAWYARGTYFLTINDDRVVLYKGRPGGAFGWDPTVETMTDIRSSDLTAAQRDDLESELTFSSRSDAEEYLERLEERLEQRRSDATTTTTAAPGPAP